MRSNSFDIAIVGAGPAGLMASVIAARAGASVALFDANSWPGGRLGLQTQPLQGPRSMYRDMNGIDFCKKLLDDATSSGVEVALETTVSDLRRTPTKSASFDVIHTPRGKNTEVVHARAIILAAGSWEPWVNFPGSNLPGVMLSGDAQIMLNIHDKLPGKRALMVGSDNTGLLISANLIDAGANVIAVVDESPRVIGREVNAAPLRDSGVEVLTSTKVIEARGEDRVESITVANINASGNVTPNSNRTFEVDTICLAMPRTPESSLASQIDVPLHDVEIFGGPTPVHDRYMQTPVDECYVCGDASGVENGAASLESGRLAGLYASRSLGFSLPDAKGQERLARARLGYLRRGRRGAMRCEAKIDMAKIYRAHGKLK